MVDKPRFSFKIIVDGSDGRPLIVPETLLWLVLQHSQTAYLQRHTNLQSTAGVSLGQGGLRE